MSRIYWRILLTAAAIMLLGGGGYIGIQLYETARQRSADYQYQPASKPSLPIEVPGKAQSPPYQPNCDYPQKHQDAELCAQWAGVQQAVEANRLASLNDQITVWIVMLTALGTLGLILTLLEQRKTARAELQAYVAVQMTGLPNFAPDEIAHATIKITNTGTTPAYDMIQYGTVIVAAFPLDSDPLAKDLIHHGVGSRNTLHNREPYNAYIYGAEAVAAEEFDAVQAGTKVVYVIGNVDYRDAFNRQRRTEFCYFLNQAALEDAQRQWALNVGKSDKKPINVRWALANLHNNAK